ncbi:MAG: DUF502 domain-containing protein [FCB group bacterium]|nr:DUF502 domain-containing protein [FCB group bacterium]
MNRFTSHIRRTFIAGLLTIAPLALTVYILKIVFAILDKPTATLLRRLGIEIPGLGILITVVFVYLLGMFVANVLGKKFFEWGERLLTAIPIVNPIYKTIKQITQAFSGTASRNFRAVVYIQYPRKETWTLAFVTGESVNNENQEFFHLFVPTTPNPTSGFFIMIPKQDTIPARMDVEEGLKAIISGGMLAPKRHEVHS